MTPIIHLFSAYTHIYAQVWEIRKFPVKAFYFNHLETIIEVKKMQKSEQK